MWSTWLKSTSSENGTRLIVLRYSAFVALIAIVVGLRSGVFYAEVLDCYGSSTRHCETDPVTVCTSPEVSTNPAQYYCEENAWDTCEDFCGAYPSESSTCEAYPAEWNETASLWCAAEWLILCDCMDV